MDPVIVVKEIENDSVLYERLNNPIDEYLVQIKKETDEFAINRERLVETNFVTEKKLFECDACGESFIQSDILIKHKQSHATKSKFECNVCGKVLSRRSELNSHKLIHSEFVCTTCGKLFSRKSYLLYHMMSHVSEKPFKCDTCGQLFSCKKMLNIHTSTHNVEKSFENNNYGDEKLPQTRTEYSADRDNLDESDEEIEKNAIITDTEDNIDVQEEVHNNGGEFENMFFKDNVKSITNSYISESQWITIPPPSSSVHSNKNIVFIKPGLTESSKNIETIRDAFSLFITEEMVTEITDHTNRYIINTSPQTKITKSTRNTKPEPVSVQEMYAFIAILLAAGRNRGRRLSISELWTKEELFRQPFFTAAMSRDRFVYIYCTLRFDNRETRTPRYEPSYDRLVPIRNVVDNFVQNCKKNFSPGANITVDERLVTFGGKCPFKVSIINKPGRYAMKIWVAADTDTAYITNLQVYTGMFDNIGGTDRKQRVLMELIRDYFGTGRGITTNLFFTSIPLANSLMDINLTTTGILRSVKRDVPEEVLESVKQEELTGAFGFNDATTLVSYVPKKKCVDLLVSTQFHSPEFENEERKKQAIITHYNRTKDAVETGYKMTREYSCARFTQRWPLRIFMEVLDIATLNSFIVWKCKFPQWKRDDKSCRKSFIRQLSMDLAKANVESRRQKNIKFHKPQQEALNLFIATTSSTDSKSELSPTIASPTIVDVDVKNILTSIATPIPKNAFISGRCTFCPPSIYKRSRIFCQICRKAVCSSHRRENKMVSCTSCYSFDS